MNYDSIRFIAIYIVVAGASVSICCTLLQLWLIYDMKRWNEYLQIVVTITVCQFFYSLGFLFIPFHSNPVCLSLLLFFVNAGSCASALWTNVISYLVYRIVKYLRSFELRPYYLYVLASITAISVGLAAVEVAVGSTTDQRISSLALFTVTNISIFVNLVLYVLISIKVSRMAFGSKTEPVIVLSARLKYYPLIEICLRVVIVWYAFQFGIGNNREESFTAPLPTIAHVVSLFAFSALVPLEGALYFWVFLVMRPVAYTHLKKRLNRLCRCLRRRHNTDSISTRTISDEDRVRSGLFSITALDNTSGGLSPRSSSRPQRPNSGKLSPKGLHEQQMTERGSIYNVEGIGARLSRGDSAQNYTAASTAYYGGSRSGSSKKNRNMDDDPHISLDRIREKSGEAIIHSDGGAMKCDEEEGNSAAADLATSVRSASNESSRQRSGNSRLLSLQHLSALTWTGSAVSHSDITVLAEEHLLDDDELAARINSSYHQRQRSSEVDDHNQRESELVARAATDVQYFDNPISRGSGSVK